MANGFCFTREDRMVDKKHTHLTAALNNDDKLSRNVVTKSDKSGANRISMFTLH